MSTKRKVLFCLFGILFIGAVTYGGLYLYTQNERGKVYQEMKEEKKSSETEKQTLVDEAEKTPQKESKPEIPVDFDELQKENPDIYAWITIPDTGIDYPVLQKEDDDTYYLTHTAAKKQGLPGSIYSECQNQKDFSDPNTVLYGHNMKNGSMFGTLDKYQDKELFEQHPEFYLYLPDKILKYRIFSCYAGRTGSEGYRYHFPEAEDFQTFLDTVSSYRDYDTGTELSATDRIVTLSTCVNSRRNYRYLVHGKLSSEIITEE